MTVEEIVTELIKREEPFLLWTDDTIQSNIQMSKLVSLLRQTADDIEHAN